MGLLDDPMGWLFGDEDKSGTIDKRVDRTAEGDEWWEKWSSIFGDEGAGDPSGLYQSALDALNKTVTVNFGGKSYTMTPKSSYNTASSYLGLLQPWFDAGMELERGRYGSTYYDEGDSGVLGSLIGNMGSGAGKGLADWATK